MLECNATLCLGVRKGVFAYSPISDDAIGAILLVLSLVVLCVCLLTMVKVLHSLMKGGVAKIIKKVINSKFPKPFGWLAGNSCVQFMYLLRLNVNASKAVSFLSFLLLRSSGIKMILYQ